MSLKRLEALKKIELGNQENPDDQEPFVKPTAEHADQEVIEVEPLAGRTIIGIKLTSSLCATG